MRNKIIEEIYETRQGNKIRIVDLERRSKFTVFKNETACAWEVSLSNARKIKDAIWHVESRVE